MTQSKPNTKWSENRKAKGIAKAIIWKIAQDEGGHILHYNEWLEDEWEEFEKLYMLKDD